MAGFTRTEAETLAAIYAWRGPVIVDFDETLFLRNSTEEFLDSARPALLAALMLRLLDICAPWRFTGGATVRDVWRVWAVSCLFPWTRWRWRARASQMANHANVPLVAALQARGEPFIVASLGFSPLIRPLLDSMGFGDIRLIACAVTRRDRRAAKLAAITEAIGAAALGRTMVITDSADDAEVLAACALPCLTIWSGARFGRALRRVYLPGDYLVHVKRPLQAGAFRRLLTDDLVLWMLMSARQFDLRFLCGIAALFFSLWAVYEIGYWENDVCAHRLEVDPVVSPHFAGFDTGRFAWKAWAAAILLAVVAGLAIPPADWSGKAAAWLAVLVGLRATYWLYNRIDKPSRVWLYLVLHVFRTLALAVVVPVGAVGMMAGVAQICARWQEYFWYRMARTPGGFRWRDTPLRLIQLLFFLLCLVALACARADVWTWRTAALLGWSLFLARKDIRVALRSAHRLDGADKERPRHEDHRDQGLAGGPAPEGRPL